MEFELARHTVKVRNRGEERERGRGGEKVE